jgi:hypothetical protein
MTMLTKMADALGHADGAGLSYEDMARAALEAIREPDERLLEGVSLSADHTIESMGEGYPTEEQSCANIFTAMIDAILSEGEALWPAVSPPSPAK